ncbi:MAG: hypothetical protein O7C59_07865 [Rickettsia endosymbiont of Ixodes persulcatus]|nr:hypothetical protein [Rickettsia endosymbiont of Ixodes persulcatus]
MKATKTTYKKDPMGLTPSQIVNELNRFIVGQEKSHTTILSQLLIKKAYYRTNLARSRLVIIFDN